MWSVYRGLRRLVLVQPSFDVSLLSTRTWRFFWPRESKPAAKTKDQQQQQQKAIQQQQQVGQNLYDKESMRQLVRQQKVVIFMKGQPNRPLCGYSNAVCQILQMHGVEFTAHDVLHNDKLKSSLKEFSEWPTIPQVFIDGEFIGGFDILLIMHKNGDLVKELQKAGIKSKIQQQLATENDAANAAKSTAANPNTATPPNSPEAANSSTTKVATAADSKPKQQASGTAPAVQQVIAAVSNAAANATTTPKPALQQATTPKTPLQQATTPKPPLQQAAEVKSSAPKATVIQPSTQPPMPQPPTKAIPEKQATDPKSAPPLTDPKSAPPTAKH